MIYLIVNLLIRRKLPNI